MKNLILLAASLAFLHLTQGAGWWRTCNKQPNHEDFEKRYPSEISSVDVKIKDGGSSDVGCSSANKGCKIPARSTLDITIKLRSKKSAKKVKATLQGHMSLLGWISAVTVTKLNLPKGKIKKKRDHTMKFEYTLPITGFRGMKIPTAIRITGDKRGKEIVVGCVVFPMKIV